jgi:putative transposase
VSISRAEARVYTIGMFDEVMSRREPIREKRHRLPKSHYRGTVLVALTAAVRERRPLFRDAEVVAVFEQKLAQAARKHACTVPVYCFMPDHLHLMLWGRTATSDTWRAMVAFKQQTGYWLSQHRPRVRWQKDFYDHIVRSREDWRAQVRYIVANPVRAGLVAHWQAYPHTGAIGHDLSRIVGN